MHLHEALAGQKIELKTLSPDYFLNTARSNKEILASLVVPLAAAGLASGLERSAIGPHLEFPSTLFLCSGTLLAAAWSP